MVSSSGGRCARCPRRTRRGSAASASPARSAAAATARPPRPPSAAAAPPRPATGRPAPGDPAARCVRWIRPRRAAPRAWRIALAEVVALCSSARSSTRSPTSSSSALEARALRTMLAWLVRKLEARTASSRPRNSVTMRTPIDFFAGPRRPQAFMQPRAAFAGAASPARYRSERAALEPAGVGRSASQARTACVITPPPRHTSPSYSTADWPGVTAHCGCANRSRTSSPAPAPTSQGASVCR